MQPWATSEEFIDHVIPKFQATVRLCSGLEWSSTLAVVFLLVAGKVLCQPTRFSSLQFCWFFHVSPFFSQRCVDGKLQYWVLTMSISSSIDVFSDLFCHDWNWWECWYQFGEQDLWITWLLKCFAWNCTGLWLRERCVSCSVLPPAIPFYSFWRSLPDIQQSSLYKWQCNDFSIQLYVRLCCLVI